MTPPYGPSLGVTVITTRLLCDLFRSHCESVPLAQLKFVAIGWFRMLVTTRQSSVLIPAETFIFTLEIPDGHWKPRDRPGYWSHVSMTLNTHSKVATMTQNLRLHTLEISLISPSRLFQISVIFLSTHLHHSTPFSVIAFIRCKAMVESAEETSESLETLSGNCNTREDSFLPLSQTFGWRASFVSLMLVGNKTN